MNLAALAAHDPARLALCDDNKSLTFGQLQKEIAHRAQDLRGVAVLALALDNGVDWLIWDLAALAAGVICVPLPPFFTKAQVEHTLRTAGASHIVTGAGLRRINEDHHCVPGHGDAEADAGSDADAACEISCNPGCQGKCRTTSYHADFIYAAAAKTPNHLPVGTAKITFTSGTTGTAKGVCLPQTAMTNVATGIVQLLGEDFVGTHHCVLPLAVLLENVAGAYAALLAGCTVQLCSLERFGASYENLHGILKAASANSVILVPEILRTLMAQVAVLGPLPNLRFIAVGGSKLDPALIAQARAMGLPVYEGYGLSECASVVSMNTPKTDQIGSVGQPLPHVDLHIDNGSIHITNPGFLGYIGTPAQTVFDTGDLGAQDDHGYVYLTGRRKNVLITSYGRNVSPEWVEAALLAQSQIAQAVVYGDAQAQLSALIVPSKVAGSPPKTQTDLKSEIRSTIQSELESAIQSAIQTANSSLPDYAQVHDFQIIPPLNAIDGLLTGTGRPRREAVFNRYINTTQQGEIHDVL